MAYVEIDKLKKHIAWQSGRIEQLENKNISKKHNKRGAGRKPKIDANAEEEVADIEGKKHKQLKI